MRDTRRRLLALARELEPDFRDDFIKTVHEIQSQAKMDALVEAIASGDINEVIRVLQMRQEVWARLDARTAEAFLRGAAYQIERVPKKAIDPASGAQLLIQFQGTQPRAADIVFQMGARLVTGIDNSQRDLLVAVLAEGLEESKPPAQLALDLVGRRLSRAGRRTGGVIGLTERDAMTVQRARSALASGDPERMRTYLRLKSRNKSLDGVVGRAIQAEKPVSRADIARLTGHLADKYLRNRGKMIARTESIAALNAGRREAMQQVIDRGAAPASAVTRVWDSTGDARTRPDHLRMEGQEVRWDQPFMAPDGSLLMGPGDSSLGASADQVIGCRCYEEIKVDWLALAV